MAIDEKVIEQKIANKETLTPEESKFVMGYPNEGPGNVEESDEELGLEAEEETAPPAGDKDKAGSAKTDEAKKESEADKAKEAAKAAESEKKDEKADEGIHNKIKTELEKPEGQEDLTGLTDREKGLYYELKAERRKRQKAEEDRDEVLFRDVKARKLAEAKAAQEKEKPAEEEDILKGEEDDNFITVKQAKEILKLARKPTGELEEVEARQRNTAIQIAQMSARDVVESRIAGGQKDLPDYDTTMEIGELIVEGNPEYQKQIYAAFKAGRNPALVTYDIIRKDPKFAILYGKKAEKKEEGSEDKAKAGKETLKKIEENEGKAKTSGAQGGAGADSGEEYKLEQLVAMTPSQFRKVPKKVREKFLFNT